MSGPERPGAGPPDDGVPRVLVEVASVPVWLRDLLERLPDLDALAFSRFLPPATGARPAAVLIALGEGPDGPDVLLIERAHTMRSHAGQPAFPGGRQDDADGGPVDAALREAQEETGLDPSAVTVVATLPAVWIPVSGAAVTPVLAWWHRDCPVAPGHPDEVRRVVRIALADLADPASRWVVRHPSGWQGPAFDVAGLLVWGFTAGLLDRLLEFGGWARDWDRTRVRDLPAAVLAASERERVAAGVTWPRPERGDVAPVDLSAGGHATEAGLSGGPGERPEEQGVRS